MFTQTDYNKSVAIKTFFYTKSTNQPKMSIENKHTNDKTVRYNRAAYNIMSIPYGHTKRVVDYGMT
jgi:hypothetical protein